MTASQRLKFLKIGAACAGGLLVLNFLVLPPVESAWGAQSDRIQDLEKKVQHGQQLIDRQAVIRSRWDEMLHANLPPDVSAAENNAFQAIDRWARAAGITFSSLTPQWQSHDEGYETLDCRASITGSQPALARFIYELETGSVPVNLEEYEITTRDDRGAVLTMTARFSFLRIENSSNPGRASR